jgi:DNA ligase-1
MGKSTESVPSPMLAQEFNKQKLKISYPCYIQPKLDGYRAVYYQGKLYTRKGLEYNNEAVSEILLELKGIPLVLDGELYISKDAFSDLGVLRKKKLSIEDKIKCSKLRFCVYDIIDVTKSYQERKELLDKLFTSNKFEKLLNVETRIVKSELEIKENHNTYISHYEGTIIRNGNAVYECGKRSYNLQKYKDFMDAEFLITGYSKEQGDGLKWHCRTENGSEFKVSSTGTKLECKKLYLEGDSFVGKWLWVKFFEYTPDGIPRFPKTMRPGIDAIRVD